MKRKAAIYTSVATTGVYFSISLRFNHSNHIQSVAESPTSLNALKPTPRARCTDNTPIAFRSSTYQIKYAPLRLQEITVTSLSLLRSNYNLSWELTQRVILHDQYADYTITLHFTKGVRLNISYTSPPIVDVLPPSVNHQPATPIESHCRAWHAITIHHSH